jgi:hypothetical protein
MIYLRAGLFAEGRSDYEFLCRLLDRLLDALAAPLFPGKCDIGETRGIDAPLSVKGKRADRIAAAISENADLCELFVIHADGGGDPDEVRRSCVEPGVAAARAAQPDREVIAAACIPVREIEAWLLTDPQAFRVLLGGSAAPNLPRDPEREIDPKAALRRILKEGGARRDPESVYALFGENVRLESLRALPAFQAFESELTKAIRDVAQSQGHPA